jgi:hypothetical protein
VTDPADTRPMDPAKKTVPVPCPNCSTPVAVVIYRHFDHVSLMCRECEHSWDTNVSAHPALKHLPPFTI